MTKRLAIMKRKILSDTKVKGVYDGLANNFDLVNELIAARIRAGLTQAQLVQRMHTTQSVIARLESGLKLPNVGTLLKYAAATQSRASIKLDAT